MCLALRGVALQHRQHWNIVKSRGARQRALTNVSTPSTPPPRPSRDLLGDGSRGSSAPSKEELNGSFTINVGLMVSCKCEGREQDRMQQDRVEARMPGLAGSIKSSPPSLLEFMPIWNFPFLSKPSA